MAGLQPLDWIEASELLLERAASLKARHPLSVADAWIAAAAQQAGTTLLHKDPEFRAIAELAQEWLGAEAAWPYLLRQSGLRQSGAPPPHRHAMSMGAEGSGFTLMR